MADPIKDSTFPDLSLEDTVSFEITPSTDPASVEFVLESDPAITRWKALELHAAGGHAFRNVETHDTSHGPQSMTASAADLRGARLVIAKAKIFDIHIGMYELRGIDAQLGKRLRLVWRRDADRAGSVAGFFRDLGHGVDTAANAAAGAVEAVMNAIADAVADVIETVGNLMARALDAIGGLFKGIPKIGPIIRGFFHWLGTIVSAAFDCVATAIKAVSNLFADVVGGLLRIVGGALGGLVAWDARRAGRSLLRGLIDIGAGVAGAVILILAKVLAFAQSIVFMQLGERPLTQVERALLQRVYRGSVAYANIHVVQGFAGFFTVNDRPFTLAEKIYLKGFDPATQPDVLVHECCHVWQYQHSGGRYVMEALAAQAWAGGYDWRIGFRGVTRWQDLNREQQAQFIQDGWTMGRHVAPAASGSGVFYADDPIGREVEFTDTDGTSYTSRLIEAITYIRGRVSFRLTRFF